MTDTPISDEVMLRHAHNFEVVPYLVAQELERKVASLEQRVMVDAYQIDKLRARNDKLDAELTNERIARFAAEAEHNSETERCAKIASEFQLSPVVGKAIAELILRRE